MIKIVWENILTQTPDRIHLKFDGYRLNQVNGMRFFFTFILKLIAAFSMSRMAWHLTSTWFFINHVIHVIWLSNRTKSVFCKYMTLTE